MFWITEPKTDPGSSQLEMSYMDGSVRTVIANLTGTSEVNSITYDPISDTLYWIDKGNKLIGFLQLDERVPRKLLQDHLREPFGVAAHGAYIFWSDAGTGAWSGGIYRAFKNNGSNVQKVVDLMQKPLDLSTRDSSLSSVAGKRKRSVVCDIFSKCP